MLNVYRVGITSTRLYLINMIPKFKFYFSPFLKSLAEHSPIRLCDLSTLIANELKISHSDLEEKTKGGKISKHSSRINYCAAYLKKMGLVESVSQGVYKISDRGIEVLAELNTQFTLDDLRALPEFIKSQVNPNNSNIVYVKQHIRGKKIIKPYFCNKVNLKAQNPNIEQCITENQI